MVYPGLATVFSIVIALIGVFAGNGLAHLFLGWGPLSKLDPKDTEYLMFRGALGALGGFVGLYLGLILFRRLTEFVSSLERVPLLEKAVVMAGVVMGLVIGLLATSPFRTLNPSGPIIQAMACVLGSLLGVALSLSTKRQLAQVFPAAAGRELPAGVAIAESNLKFLDTNIIIDGRIADICKTGFLEGPTLIPGFVLEELHDIADSADGLKRARGRRGLEVLNRLKSEVECPVRVFDDYPEDVDPADPVDQRLVKLAKHFRGAIVTNDYSLNEIAKLHEVPVLNVHELAAALKPVFLPGEELTVTIVKAGNQPGQGVGYLDDGTMVVVEEADHLIGRQVPVVVKTLHHSRAGKMIFGEVAGEEVLHGSGTPASTARVPTS